MTHVQIIPGDFTITDPAVPRYPLPKQRKTLTSDDFTGAGDPVGTLTTAALGGTPALWGGSTPSGWERSEGVLIPTLAGGAGNLTLDGLMDGTAVEVTVVELPPTGGSIFLSLRISETVRTHLVMLGNGNLVIREQNEAGQRDIATAGSAYSAGDRLRFGVDQGIATLSVNGVVVASAPTTSPAPTYMTLSYYPTSGTGALDDLVVTVPVAE